jgi:hypothetical protein
MKEGRQGKRMDEWDQILEKGGGRCGVACLKATVRGPSVRSSVSPPLGHPPCLSFPAATEAAGPDQRHAPRRRVLQPMR